MQRTWKFFKISFWLDLLQVGALEATRAVAQAQTYAIHDVAVQYVESLVFSFGLAVFVDHPTQNYVPLQWRVPLTLCTRAGFFIGLGLITMP